MVVPRVGCGEGLSVVFLSYGYTLIIRVYCLCPGRIEGVVVVLQVSKLCSWCVRGGCVKGVLDLPWVCRVYLGNVKGVVVVLIVRRECRGCVGVFWLCRGSEFCQDCSVCRGCIGFVIGIWRKYELHECTGCA